MKSEKRPFGKVYAFLPAYEQYTLLSSLIGLHCVEMIETSQKYSG
ncbi:MULTISPECIES: hypothetical protein [Nitrosomonas]|nr:MULTISPECIES: hypothetical protein [Nitrosomonas]